MREAKCPNESFSVEEYQKELSFSRIQVQIFRLGNDYQVMVWGGDRPHIGCVAMAIPRPSLAHGGKVSCTSSVINVTGHKDESICRYLAEQVCRKRQATTVCSGGFHREHMTEEEIGEVLWAVRELGEAL